MGWDASRPVPWQRLIREWLLYVAVMAVLFVVFFNDRNLLGIFGGLLISGPIFLAFGYALAKLGYRRRSFKDLRAESTSRSDASPKADASGGTSKRPKPAPTKRTGGGQQRPGGNRKRP